MITTSRSQMIQKQVLVPIDMRVSPLLPLFLPKEVLQVGYALSVAQCACSRPLGFSMRMSYSHPTHAHVSVPLISRIQNWSVSDLLPTSRTQSIYAIYHFLDIRSTAMSHVASGSVVWPSLRYLWSYSGIDTV